MKKYGLQFILNVYDSKYRELVNVLDRELSLVKPIGCHYRMAFQSLKKVNQFEFKEEWTDLNLMKSYLDSLPFHSLKGGFELLCEVSQFQVYEYEVIEEFNDKTIN